MFNYFINPLDEDVRYPTKKYFKWNLVKKMYARELNRVKDYYRNREYNYDNNNMFIKLIKTLARDNTLPVLDYLEYINTDAKYAISRFGFVSNRSHGSVMDNVLLERESSEAFLYIDNAIDILDMETGWRDYESIRVISSDITDIYYPTLFKYTRPAGRITIYEVDIKAIMLQYYYWSKERKALDRDTSANVFFPTVVIPNISNSIIDQAIWNRFKSFVIDEPMVISRMRHPIALIDYTKGIDSVLLDIIKDVRDTSIPVSQLLKTIPNITNSDTYHTLQITKSYYNKQSKWILWVARLNDIVIIHKLLGDRGYKLNRALFNSLPYELKLMNRRESTYVGWLDPLTEVSILADIEYLEKTLGKR